MTRPYEEIRADYDLAHSLYVEALESRIAAAELRFVKALDGIEKFVDPHFIAAKENLVEICSSDSFKSMDQDQKTNDPAFMRAVGRATVMGGVRLMLGKLSKKYKLD